MNITFIYTKKDQDTTPVETAWCNEPITHAFHELMDLSKLGDYFGMKTRKEGLSVYAAEHNKIVGEREIEPIMDFLNLMTEEHFNKYRQFLEPLVCLTEQAVIKYREFMKDKNPEHVVHFCGLAVAKSHRKKGLAHELMRQSVAHLQNKNMDYALVECTGSGSRRCVENIINEYGGGLLLEVPYRSHCEKFGVPVIKDHKSYTVFWINLKTK